MIQGAIIEGPRRGGTYALVERGYVHPTYYLDTPGVHGSLLPANMVPGDLDDAAAVGDTTPSGLKLRGYQLDALQFAAGRGRRGCVLALDLGLGKTLVALQLVHALKLRPLLVLGPKQAQPVWCGPRSDAMKHFGLYINAAEGAKPSIQQVGDTLTGDGAFVHYEVLKGWHEHLLTMAPQCVLVDEVHLLRNITDTSLRVLGLVTHWSVRKRLMLTATPLVRSIMDLWMPLHLAEPGAWGKRKEFGVRYAGYVQGEYAMQETGETNADELRARMSRTMVAVSRFDARKELPLLNRQAVYLARNALDNAYLQLYRQAALDTVGWLRSEGKALAGADLQKYNALAHALSHAKLAAAVHETRQLLLSHQKVLVLTWFTDTAEQLADALRAAGEDVDVFGAIDSETPARKRTAALESLIASERRCVYVATLGTTQMSVNELVCCSGLLFVDLYWLPSTLLQAEGRLHREGQERAVDIRYLVCEDTLDTRMYDMLAERARIAWSLLGNDEGVSLTQALGAGAETNLATLLAELPKLGVGNWED